MTAAEVLHIQTDLDPKPVLEMFLSNAGIHVPIERETRAQGRDITAFAFTPFFVAQARYIGGSPGARAIHERFGFWTDVRMSFEPLHGEEYREVLQDTLIKGGLALLQTHDFDLALVFHNDEHVVLQRLKGKLTLNSLYDIWTPERLAMVKLPYTMEALVT